MLISKDSIEESYKALQFPFITLDPKLNFRDLRGLIYFKSPTSTITSSLSESNQIITQNAILDLPKYGF